MNPGRAFHLPGLLATVFAAGAVVTGEPCDSCTDPPQSYAEYNDPSGDAVLRRADLNADGVVNPPIVQGRAATFPDLREITFGRWTLANPNPNPPDPYLGMFTSNPNAELVRIDIEFKGLVNPPGSLGFGGFGVFNPYVYGNSPVYGFIEFDMDNDRDTGGELGPAALYRYLAVVGRFGQCPGPGDTGRAAMSGTDLDPSFSTSPQFERSGAEFVLALCGCFTPTVVNTFGDNDGVFGPGNTWIVSGRFFQRAGGFRDLSAVYGGSQPGVYDPVVNLRFRHNIGQNVTTVSLVYPLTMHGASVLRGGSSCPTEDMDLSVANDTCIDEAIDDVIKGAGDPNLAFTFPDTWTLANRWAKKTVGATHNPLNWRVRAVVGTSYSQANPDAPIVWTDAGFNERACDFNSDGVVTSTDRAIAVTQLGALDSGPSDCDLMPNGSVTICAFGPNFSVFDINYDGRINSQDIALIPATPQPGDINNDCRVNTTDLALLLLRFGMTGGAQPSDGDLNGDGNVNTTDLAILLLYFGAVCP